MGLSRLSCWQSKSAFSRKEGETSIVFDEVDTGVSDGSGCAQKIHKIGSNGQVLAISHIAA